LNEALAGRYRIERVAESLDWLDTFLGPVR
jgi:hypothetical protein